MTFEKTPHKVTLKKDTTMKSAEITKVARNTAFSSPLLVNDTDALDDLANPVPLDCMNIMTINATAKMVWMTKTKFCITKILYSM